MRAGPRALMAALLALSCGDLALAQRDRFATPLMGPNLGVWRITDDPAVRGLAECRVCKTDDPGEVARHLEEVLRSGARVTGGPAAVADLGHAAVTAKLVEVYSETAAAAGARRA